MTPALALEQYARTRDPEAFHTLVQTYQPMVFGVCWRILRSRQDADDAVQETFLRLARSAHEIRSNVGAWLHACARTCSLMQRRAENARRRHELAAAEERPTVTEDNRGFAEIASLVDHCLEQLSEDDRELIVQRYYLDRTQSDIAESLGISRVAVGKRLDKAIARLRTRYAARAGGTVGALALGLLTQAQAAVPYAPNAKLAVIAVSGVGGAPVAATAVPAMGGFAAWAAAAVVAVGGGTVALAIHDQPKPVTITPVSVTVPVTAPVAPQPQSAQILVAVSMTDVMPASIWPDARSAKRPRQALVQGSWWRLNGEGEPLVSTDGGGNWQSSLLAQGRKAQSLGDLTGDPQSKVVTARFAQGGRQSTRFQQVSPVTARVAWAAGLDGLYRTVDGGAEWSMQASLASLITAAGVVNGQIRGLAAKGADELVVVIATGQRLVLRAGTLALIARDRGERLLHSADGGATWRLLDTQLTSVTSDLRWQDGNLWWLREELVFGDPEDAALVDHQPGPNTTGQSKATASASVSTSVRASAGLTLTPNPANPGDPTTKSTQTTARSVIIHRIPNGGSTMGMVRWPVLARHLVLGLSENGGSGWERRWSVAMPLGESGGHRLLVGNGVPVAVATRLGMSQDEGPCLLPMQGEVPPTAARLVAAEPSGARQVQDVAALSQDRLVAAIIEGGQGRIDYSLDRGRTWIRLTGLELPPNPAEALPISGVPAAAMPIALMAEGEDRFLVCFGYDRVATDRPDITGGRIVRVVVEQRTVPR